MSTEELGAPIKRLNYNLSNATSREYLTEPKHAFKSFGFLQEIISELRRFIVPAIRRTLSPDGLSDVERTALGTLKKGDNIMTLPADKRRKTVIWAKLAPFKKQTSCYTTLSPTAYRLLYKDPVSKSETKIKNHLKKQQNVQRVG